MKLWILLLVGKTHNEILKYLVESLDIQYYQIQFSSWGLKGKGVACDGLSTHLPPVLLWAVFSP